MHCSSFHGQVEIVEMLLSHGADESAKDIRGRTVATVCDMAQYDVDQVRAMAAFFYPTHRLDCKVGGGGAV